MRLTDLSIRKLGSPSSGQKTYYDDALPGFGIRISQGGTKSYVVMYGTKRRLKTIGRYPDFKLADARREAKRIQSDLTLLNMASTHCESKNKPRTVQDYSRLLSRHFSFKKDIAEISRKDVMAVVSSLSATPSESQHAYVAIRTMMNWCVKLMKKMLIL